MIEDHPGNVSQGRTLGAAPHAAATRLRGAAQAVEAAGSTVRREAAAALGGDAWLGAAAHAAQRAGTRAASVPDQVAAQLCRVAAALDSLGTAQTEVARKRSQLLDEAHRLGFELHGDSLLPVGMAPMPLLVGKHLPAQWAAVRATERAADAAAAASLRAVAVDLHRLRLAASQPVAVLIDPSQALLLHRADLLLLNPGGRGTSVQQVAVEFRAVLSRRDPVAVRAHLESLPAEVRRALATAHASLIGSADGVPPAIRYAANRVVLARALGRARSRGETAVVARLTGWLRPGRQFLLVDLAAGRIAEVFGDLDTAAHVAVVVPGMLNGLANFDAGLAANSRRLHEQASRSAPGQVATIAWLGYRTPGVASAPFDNHARAALGRLRDLVAGLVLRAAATTTVVADSYGSLVTGRALGEGLRVDAVVVLGSPGMGARTAAGLHAPVGTRLFAARAPGDAVGWSENFGRDPADPRFGIPRIATGDPGAGGPTGHTSYLRGDSECMRNLGRIITSHYDQVTVIRPSRVELVAGSASTLVEVAGSGLTVLRAVQRGLASALPAPLERLASDVIEAQERTDRLARRIRDPDLYAQIAADAATRKM